MVAQLETINEGQPYADPLGEDKKREEYLDRYYAFFQNAYHLKDWIKNDNGVLETHRDRAECFINTGFLFSIESTFQTDLDNGDPSGNLRSKLEQNGISLSQNINIMKFPYAEGGKWSIIDKDNEQTYPVKKEDSKLRQRL